MSNLTIAGFAALSVIAAATGIAAAHAVLGAKRLATWVVHLFDAQPPR